MAAEQEPGNQYTAPRIEALIQAAADKFWAWEPDPSQPTETLGFYDAARLAVVELIPDGDTATARQYIADLTYQYETAPFGFFQTAQYMSERLGCDREQVSWSDVARVLALSALVEEMEDRLSDIGDENERRLIDQTLAQMAAKEAAENQPQV